MLCRLSVPPATAVFQLTICVLSARRALCAHHGPPGVDALATTPEASAAPSQVEAGPRGCPGPVTSGQKSCDHSRHLHGSSIAGGLVKGALSVTASAYKALFSGPPVTAQPIVSEHQTAALMAHLFEMGFCDQQLNLRLLKKHNYNILQVVTELLQLSNNWPSHRY
ncbi:next to BRCA1 gene 1 protein-like [Heterocephalus glaber]|uniref:Next to BRCA1 gene 1 protein-like n=1 Tax=Heterocephalus glaber TaxID=10181 RepID=A0AAX6S7C8_HETGA|nr:next to BRCA1 gene 1 protein-like [Heterocephalus glaber]